MTRSEANEFVDQMKELGDEWTTDKAMDVYKDKDLQEALDDRTASIAIFNDIVGKIINR